ncbi:MULTISPECIES: DNA methylase [unclassified Pseudomonas]|uniref:DNA methylase n=1 Tax=unclassified Pseudomonas TaxID=196821 RepID=UPI0020B8868B|nr:MULTISPECIES: DNA methylase [unclassified Pseudomonas]MCP3789178.1 DNA methylase [Pseudomonas sp. N2-11]MDI3374291.1 DNA methylase [Pseudomonas sp. V104_6]
MIPISAALLGIDMHQCHGRGLYKWLLASFLIGKRIRASVAVQAYQVLVNTHGLDTPGKLARCPHHTLVKLLGQAGYARYDESTARRLHRLGKGLEAEMDHVLLDDALDMAHVNAWLLRFEGVGPKTLEIFMREAAPVLQHQRAQ